MQTWQVKRYMLNLNVLHKDYGHVILKLNSQQARNFIEKVQCR